MLSFEKCLLESFAHFSLLGLCLFLIDLKEFLGNLDMSTLSDGWVYSKYLTGFFTFNDVLLSIESLNFNGDWLVIFFSTLCVVQKESFWTAFWKILRQGPLSDWQELFAGWQGKCIEGFWVITLKSIVLLAVVALLGNPCWTSLFIVFTFCALWTSGPQC